jgi:hypothetical protein
LRVLLNCDKARGARQRIHHNTEGPHDLWHGRIDFRPNRKCVGRAKEAPEFARSASLPLAHHRTDQPHKFIDGNVGGFAKCESVIRFFSADLAFTTALTSQASIGAPITTENGGDISIEDGL